MRYIEERLRELEAYRPELTRRPDFGEFWENTLSESHDRELSQRRSRWITPAGTPVSMISPTTDLTGRGFTDGFWFRPSAKRGGGPV